jgi:hypothetical protein
MTNEQRNVIRELTNQGYAVIIWTPEELGNASVKDIQDRSIELGHDIINSLTDWEDEA